MLVVAVVAAVTMRIGHAVSGHTFYLGKSIVGTCGGKCENLNLTAGLADTTTSQKIGNTAGKYQIEPDVSSTATTGTPFTSAVSGYAWVYNTTLGGSTIPSGTWTFNLTIGLNVAAGAPVGSLWITVWNCNTNSLWTCAFLFKNWDNSTNVLATTTATKYTYTTGTIGPFCNVHSLAVTYLSFYTTISNSAGFSVTAITFSSGFSFFVPFWFNYFYGVSRLLCLIWS